MDKVEGQVNVIDFMLEVTKFIYILTDIPDLTYFLNNNQNSSNVTLIVHVILQDKNM